MKIQIIGRESLPLYLKQSFLPIIWIFKGEGDVIESRQPFKIFSTLVTKLSNKIKYFRTHKLETQ